MLRSQELSLRISEIRQRLNELAGKDSLSTEERAEVDTLSAELSGKETQYRAAVQAEEAESREHRAAGDGESAEFRSLTGRVRCGEYLQAAVEQRAVSGAEAELNAAVGLAAQGRMPWAALLPRAAPEVRQDAATAAPATGIPTNQAEILERVFARSASMYLRVDMPSVGVGESSYPVFATGTTAAQAAKGGEVDAAAATFTPNVLKPKRLSAAYLWGVEDEAELRGLESSLRDDLGMAMSDAMDKQVLTGSGAAPNVPGFLGRIDGNALGALVLPADEGDIASYNSSFGIQNDGKSLHHLYHSNSSRMVNTSNWRLCSKKRFTLSSNAIMRLSAQHPKASPSSSSVSEIIARNRCHSRPAKLNAFNRSCISSFGIQNDGKSLHHLYHSNSSRMVNTSNWRLCSKKRFTLSSNAVMRLSAQHPKASPSSSSVSEIIARNRCHRRPAKLNAFNRSCISVRTSPMRALSHSNFA